MRRDFKILHFLVCLSAVKCQPDRLETFRQSIASITEIHKLKYQNFNRVVIKNVHCVVYFYEPMKFNYGIAYGRMDDDWVYERQPSGVSARFYSCLNCKLAEWVRNKLSESLGTVPALYQKIFPTTGNRGSYGMMTLDEIAGYADRSVNILLNFFDVYTYAWSFDTSVLKTMVSLRFKIELWRTDPEHWSPTTGILEILNGIQKFTALNCGEIPSSATGDSGQFYGHPESRYDEEMETLLTNIGPTYLYNPYKQCGVGQMLLDPGSDDPVSKELGRVSVTFGCGNVGLSLAEIRQQITQTDDLEAIHWYQSIVFDSIVKIVYNKLYSMLSDASEPIVHDEIAEGFRILSFMLNNVALVPRPLTEYFRLMDPDSTKNVRGEEWTEFTAYLEANYVVNASFSSVENASDYVIRLEPERSDGLGIEGFLDKIIGKLGDYKCFVRLFEFLTFEFRRTPRTRDADKLNAFVERKFCTNASPPPGASSSGIAESFPIHQGCDLVHTLYRYCIESFLLLNDQHGNYSREKDQRQTAAVATYMSRIVYHLIVFDNAYGWPPLAKITSNLRHTWTIVSKWFADGWIYSEAVRYVHLAVAELNGFGTEFCRPPAYNYLWSGNVDYDAIGLHETIRHGLTALFVDAGVHTDLSVYPVRLTTTVLIEIFEKKMDHFESYRCTVRVQWKGERKTVGDVYESVYSLVSSPSEVYGLHDVFLKFSIAVCFYEAKTLFNGCHTEYNVAAAEYEKLKSKILPVDRFPQHLRDIVDYYNFYFETEHRKTPIADRFTETDYERVSAELLNFGVYIDFDSPKCSLYESDGGQHNDNSTSDIGSTGIIKEFFKTFDVFLADINDLYAAHR